MREVRPVIIYRKRPSGARLPEVEVHVTRARIDDFRLTIKRAISYSLQLSRKPGPDAEG